jgi:hypothetical protein
MSGPAVRECGCAKVFRIFGLLCARFGSKLVHFFPQYSVPKFIPIQTHKAQNAQKPVFYVSV